MWIKNYGLKRYEALMLCSLVGKVDIGNLWTAAAKVEKKHLGNLAKGLSER